MKRAALYIRVSTSDQEVGLQKPSCGMQKTCSLQHGLLNL